MKHTLLLLAAMTAGASAETALTIYNRNLAVVRETLPLDLKAGESNLSFDHATAQVMPDSVVLRDPTGKNVFSILEQGYRNDPVSQAMLMSHFEGQTIDFRTVYPDGKIEDIKGKIIRSGYVPGGAQEDPIIEVDGKLRFELPGKPMFPELGNDSILRPTLSWALHSDAAAKFDAQLSYLSNGFQWQADYNFVAPEDSNTATLTGWITVNNNSGTAFNGAKVKLVAGDVNIIEAPQTRFKASRALALAADAAPAGVQEKAFDDFHLYTLGRPLTIRDRESKQVEFLRAPQVKASKKYIYDAASMYAFSGGVSNQPMQGVEFPKTVATYWEFRNDESNGLGVPLPAGKMRFYRADGKDGNLEFVGENTIGHTPKNETLSLYTGNAFDLVGERKIANFASRDREKIMDETIEITVKNHSKEAKEIVVREHLWRWSNWEIQKNSDPFEKKDAQKIEFTVKLAPDEEKKISYTAHYSW